MHPLIQLQTVLIFILLVALGDTSGLWLGGFLLLLAYTWSGFRTIRSLTRVVVRMRWLLLSIFILYGWWTPGTPLLPLWEPFSPSREGVQHGILRLLVLLAIATAVHWLMNTCERGRLLAAILALTTPLQRLGFPHERFAIRLLLTLEAVPRVQSLVAEAMNRQDVEGHTLNRFIDRVRSVYLGVLEAAAHEPRQAHVVPVLEEVPRWQWAIPSLLILVGWFHGMALAWVQ